jgi:hypothetical protein
MMGGYYNVIIPVSGDGNISPAFEWFLVLYDPDYVILAPGMSKLTIENARALLNPYGIVTWDQVPQIIPEGVMGGSNLQGAHITLASALAKSSNSFARDLVAVSDDANADSSRLAFLACGDVFPTEPQWESYNGVVSLDAIGYREMILQQLAQDDRRHDVTTRLGPNDEIIPAPNRNELGSIIKDKNQFPVAGAPDILEASCAVQYSVSETRSFVGRTVPYKRTGTPIRTFDHIVTIPGMAILVSDHFEFREAVLFWNLRANGVIASWLSFLQFEQELQEIKGWLNSDFGATLFTFGAHIAFASSKNDEKRLHDLFLMLTGNESARHWKWQLSSYDALILYDYERPQMQRKHVAIGEKDNVCSFLPEYPENTFGTLGLTLEWPKLMLPSRRTNAALVSPGIKQTWSPLFVSQDDTRHPLDLLRFRITNSRYARLQIDNDSPVDFRVPSLKDILAALLQEAGVTHFREAHHSQYQRVLLGRSGSLESACILLKSSGYRELFKVLSNGTNQQLPGRPLDGRRVLPQTDLCKILYVALPSKTEDYLQTASSLPEAASHLIRLQLLERGFQLNCLHCSSTKWYRAEDVGQLFRCQRCYKEQLIESNPPWLYKLPEVIFQAFDLDSEVPLLALGHLKKNAQYNFEYELDSEVWIDDSTKKNIDFSCLRDGRVYIGEAKSNDVIDKEQFEFYENLAAQAFLDGIVFATSTTNWNSATQARIETLKSTFIGQVLVLTQSELYEQ